MCTINAWWDMYVCIYVPLDWKVFKHGSGESCMYENMVSCVVGGLE